ncbi:MAG: hypothetical protein RLZZ581_794, partial [Actinomycetota bacterium]
MKRVFVALCAGLILSSISPVMAGGVARAVWSSNLATANWSVVAVGTNQSVTNTPYQLSWNVIGGSAYNFFRLQNSGTLNVNSFSVVISQTRVGGSGAANPVDFELCSGGVWNATTNTCTGTVVLVGRASDLNLNFSNLQLPPNTELSMRAKTAVSGRNNFSTWLDVLVSRSAVRAGA